MARIYIFTPTYHRFEMTKRSLLSLKWSVEHEKNHDITLFIGDNNSPDEMKLWLASTFKGLNYKLFLSDKNVGKPRLIDYMWKQCDKNCDIVCSFDSDLVAIPEHMDWIDRCVKVLNDSRVGLVSTEQLEQCCHLERFLSKKEKINGCSVRYGNFCGIAGGCIFVSKADWISIGGYGINKIYGGDDAKAIQQISKKCNKLCVVNIDAPLIHPHDTEHSDYSNWKARMCGILQGKEKRPEPTKGFWDKDK